MAFRNYNLAPSENRVIASFNVGEGCPPSTLNNAIRQLMTDGRLLSDTVDTAVSDVTTLKGNAATGLLGFKLWSELQAAYQPYNPATAYTVGKTIRDQGAFWANIAASTAVAPPTLPTTSNASWLLVDANPGGKLAQVPIADAGTHTDPVVGGTVNNSGIFRWSAASLGWEWLYPTEAAQAKPYADAAAASASGAAASVAEATARAETAADEAEAHLHDFPAYYAGASGGTVPSVPYGAIQNQIVDPAVTMLRTTGATGGFVNVNAALTDADVTAHPLVLTKDQAGRRFERDKFQLSVRKLGAGGLGEDATAAVTGYRNYVQTQGHDVAGATDPLGLIGIDLEPGSYLINKSGAFLDETFTTKRGGWGITGMGPGTTQIVFAPVDTKKVMIHNVAYLGVQLRNFTTVCDDSAAVFLRSEARNYAGLNPQSYRVDLLGFSGVWDAIFDVLGDGNNSEWVFDGCAMGGPGTTVPNSSGTFLRLRNTAAGAEQQLNYWIRNCKPWFDDPSRASCIVDAEAGSHIHVDMSDASGWKNGTHFILRRSGFGAFSCTKFRAEMKTDQVRSMLCKWTGGYVAYDMFDAGPEYGVPRATVTHEYDVNPGPDISYTRSKIRGTTRFNQNKDPGYSSTPNYQQGYRHKQSILYQQVQWPEFEDVFDAFIFASGNNDGSQQPKGGRALVRLIGCRGRSDLISSPFWQRSHAYALGSMIQCGPCEYVCTQAGTSASSGRGPLTKGTVADGTCQWSWLRNDPRSYLTDAVVNAHLTPGADGVVEHFVHFANYDGAAPNSADPPLQVIIPPNAIITRAWLKAPAGAVTNLAGAPSGTPPRLVVRTDNGALTMIDNSASATAASAGVDLSWSGRFNVGTNAGNRTVWGDAAAGVGENLYGLDWGFAYIA